MNGDPVTKVPNMYEIIYKINLIITILRPNPNGLTKAKHNSKSRIKIGKKNAKELNKTIGINIFQSSIPFIFGLNAINAIYDINAITSKIIIYLSIYLF